MNNYYVYYSDYNKYYSIHTYYKYSQQKTRLFFLILCCSNGVALLSLLSSLV